jgi:hypothetical protein
VVSAFGVWRSPISIISIIALLAFPAFNRQNSIQLPVMRASFSSFVIFLSCSVVLQAAPATPNFRHVNVDPKIEIAYGVAVADVNGDKKPDVLLADQNLYVWYENPSWQKHILAERLTTSDHVCLAAQDVDGDGRSEIMVGAGWNPGDTVNSGAVFQLLAPALRTERWTAAPMPHEPTVHRMRWARNAAGTYDLLMVPLHGRGNKTSGEGVGVKILAYHRPANSDGKWTTTGLETSLHKTHNFDPVQWDDDREEEFLVASMEGVFLLDRMGERAKLTQLSGTESGGAGEVRLGRIPGRRFFATVEPMHGTNLVVYLEPSRNPVESGTRWGRQVLDSTLVDGHALACGDFVGLGRDQVVVGWRAMGKPGTKVGIKLFTPDAAGQQWNQTLIDDNQMACEDLCLADLNGDGRLDIVAAGRASKNVKIYFNER